MILLLGGITLYKTFALYEEKLEFNVIKGKVPEYRDIRLSVTVDGETVKEIPSKGTYETSVSCTSGEGEFDYVTWSLNVENFESGARCVLAFTTSSLSNEELTKRAVAKRRNTYRGKNITSYLNDGSLYTMISNGTFDDIYVGDYIIDSNNNKWLIADIDNYLNSGDTALTKHHVTIIPENPGIMQAKMNATDTTVGGYKGSAMYQIHLNTYLDNYVIPVFGSHVLTYRNLVTTSVNETAINRYGTASGASNNWEWVDRKIDLMSEVNVYGTIVWSSSGFDTGIDHEQYAIFKLNSEMINPNRTWYWLKDVSNSEYFAVVDQNGDAVGNGASSSGGVRPRFLID